VQIFRCIPRDSFRVREEPATGIQAQNAELALAFSCTIQPHFPHPFCDHGVDSLEFNLPISFSEPMYLLLNWKIWDLVFLPVTLLGGYLAIDQHASSLQNGSEPLLEDQVNDDDAPGVIQPDQNPEDFADVPDSEFVTLDRPSIEKIAPPDEVCISFNGIAVELIHLSCIQVQNIVRARKKVFPTRSRKNNPVS
jgi:hypothetical protein